MLSDDLLIRYSRQIMVDGVDIEGQQTWSHANILIIGVGGLGNPAAAYLCAAGVHSITLVDHDTVELSNLHRQLLHRESRIGHTKVASAKEELHSINSSVHIHAIDKKLDDNSLKKLIEQHDIVLDCTDNFASRHQINALCYKLKKALVVGAAIRWEGQLSVFDSNVKESPCYECLYPRDSAVTETCATNGIIGPVVGIVGTYQALQTLKVLNGAGSTLLGKLWIFDGRHDEFHNITLPKREDCPICGE